VVTGGIKSREAACVSGLLFSLPRRGKGEGEEREGSKKGRKEGKANAIMIAFH